MLALFYKPYSDSSHSLDKLKASMSSVKDSAVASKKTDNGNISKGYSRSLMENHQIISPKDSTTVESSSTSNEPQEPTIAHTPSPLSRNNDSSSRSEKVPSKRNVGNMEMSGSHKGSRSFAHPSSISLKQVPDVHSKSAENSSKDQQNTSYLNINTSPLNLRPHSIMKQRSESGGQKSRLTKSVDGTSSSISTHFSDSSLTGSLDGILIASDKF